MENSKRSLRFYLHIYKLIIIQDLKSKMSYRADFIISTFGILFTNIAGFLSFYILFQNFPSINGWNYNEMLFLYGFSLIALTPVQCLFDNNWNLKNHILSGDFIKYCFRPINLFFYYISEVFDAKGIGQFFFGVGILIYAWNKLTIPITAGKFLLLIVGCISASLFMIALMNAAAASGFWMLGSNHVMILAFKFKDYALYPITIFNPVFRFIFTFVIPIAFVAFYPSQFLLRPNSVTLLSYLSPLLGVAFFYLSYKLWMKGAMSYTGTGS